ncbi:PREDICTED: disease resistance protein At4g27190-like isoform X2 [Nelumbo nucifera]|uniref:Disease resistance protein At4g27190-like isoform X2 n=2 Tax=Nelumbo nucifera TaxID=4432 RepID=A0A1U7Z989_NELNU|nr:PREDICTED: disease resistance protein At4g27190-like isoform X2 [Nelumbo nucifera]DAD44851.1 TPA_asm: hypothetical protein HUJ06_003081 [Nelumbo nucifera]
MELLSSLVVEAAKQACSSLFSSVTIVTKLHGNVNLLRQETERLRNLKIKINEQLESDQKQGRVPTVQVKEWLREVQDTEIKVDLLDRKLATNNSCLRGFCPNFYRRYKLSRRAKKMLQDVLKVIDSVVLPAGVSMDSPAKGVETLPAPSIINQKAASDTLNQVLDLLEDSRIASIGIWGMGGVGKTTLVKNLNNSLESSTNPFDVVVWVTVSRDLDLRRLQLEIAERLNLQLRAGESTERRAVRLFERLKKEKKVLLILDDVWEKVDLDDVGIPQGDAHKGCKIILTTRFLDVCREMKTNKQIKVEVLDEEESWRLFCENAGQVTKLEDIEPIAKAVSRECCGLPLAITTVGKAMREKNKIELWRNALSELQKSAPYIKGIEKEVFLPLKWSYDSLQGKNTKLCFLYCSLFPEDFSVKVSELIQYWVAEGLIDEQSMEESKNKGIALTEYLKDCCMLECGAYEGTVKMHDVIRDVAIWIGFSGIEDTKFMVQSGMGLRELPLQEEIWRSFKRVSLINNKITRLPDQFLECSQVSTLFLQGNPLKERIPEGFFIGLQNLTVLNLSATHIRSLPLSVSSLVNLRALFLGDCHSLEELPSCAGLKKLEVLDLRFAHIKDLPQGMEELCNLKHLNLSYTHHLETIGTGIISSLYSLEELDMSSSAYRWGELEERKKATLPEFGSLRRLAFLSIRVDNIDLIAQESVINWLKDLKRFCICIGPTSYDASYLPSSYVEKRVILEDVDLLGRRVEELLKHAKSLVLKRCKGISEISELSIRSMMELKSLTVMGCDGITNLVRGEDVVGELSSLEELNLYHMQNLEGVWEGMVPDGDNLRNIKKIKVHECPRLKSLISYALLQQLENLREIEVTFCYSMEEVIAAKAVNEYALPRLQSISLVNLPKLRSICSWVLAWPSLRQIEVCECPRLHKLPLGSHNARTISQIKGDRLWWKELQWGDVDTHNTFQPLFEEYTPDEEEDIWTSRFT